MLFMPIIVTLIFFTMNLIIIRITPAEKQPRNLTSVVHEPSGLESLGTQLLAARTGVDEPTRAPWRLEPARTGVHEPLGGFLEARASSPGVPRPEPAREQH